MVWFFTPYSLNKKLFEAYDKCMSIVPSPDDWVCFTDGDTAFLLSDFGHQMEEYIQKYPDTGLFTCYASRCHYRCQTLPGVNIDSDSIIYHRSMAAYCKTQFHLEVDEVNRKVAGHLLLIRKKVWLNIRNEVYKNASGKNILGIDTKISNAILGSGLKIRLMKGIYIFHYLRMMEGINNSNHLI